MVTTEEYQQTLQQRRSQLQQAQKQIEQIQPEQFTRRQLITLTPIQRQRYLQQVEQKRQELVQQLAPELARQTQLEEELTAQLPEIQKQEQEQKLLTAVYERLQTPNPRIREYDSPEFREKFMQVAKEIGLYTAGRKETEEFVKKIKPYTEKGIKFTAEGKPVGMAELERKYGTPEGLMLSPDMSKKDIELVTKLTEVGYLKTTTETGVPSEVTKLYEETKVPTAITEQRMTFPQWLGSVAGAIPTVYMAKEAYKKIAGQPTKTISYITAAVKPFEPIVVGARELTEEYGRWAEVGTKAVLQKGQELGIYKPGAYFPKPISMPVTIGMPRAPEIIVPKILITPEGKKVPIQVPEYKTTYPSVYLPTPTETGRTARTVTTYGLGFAPYIFPALGVPFALGEASEAMGILGKKIEPIVLKEKPEGVSEEYYEQYKKDVAKAEATRARDIAAQKSWAGVKLGLAGLYLGGVTYQALTKPRLGPIQQIGKPEMKVKIRRIEGGQLLYAEQKIPGVKQTYTTYLREMFGRPKIEITLRKPVTYDFFGRYRPVGEKGYVGEYFVGKRGPYVATSKKYYVSGIVPAGEKIEPYILKQLPRRLPSGVWIRTEPTALEAIKVMKIKEAPSWELLTGKYKAKEVFLYKPSEKTIVGVFGAGKTQPLVVSAKYGMFKVSKEIPEAERIIVGLKKVSARTWYATGERAKVGQPFIFGTGEKQAGQVFIAKGVVYTPQKIILEKIAYPKVIRLKGQTWYEGFLMGKKAQLLQPQFVSPQEKVFRITAPPPSELQRLTLSRLAITQIFPAGVTKLQKPFFGIVPISPAQVPVFVPKVSLNIFAITAGAIIPRLRFAEALIQIPKVSTIEKVIPITIPTISPIGAARVIQTPALGIVQIQIPQVIPQIIPKITPAVLVPTITQKPPRVPRVPSKFIIKVPEPEPITPIKPRKVRLPKRELFIPFIRRRGKFRPVAKPSPKEVALRIGIRKIRRTLGASLQIRKTTGEAVPFPKTTKMFRFGKREGALTLVQRRGFRLGTRGEVSEIIRSRKAGRIKFI